MKFGNFSEIVKFQSVLCMLKDTHTWGIRIIPSKIYPSKDWMEHLILLGKPNRKMNFIRGMKNNENARIMTDQKKINNFLLGL